LLPPPAELRLAGERLREEEEPLRAEERLLDCELLLAVGRLALDERVFEPEPSPRLERAFAEERFAAVDRLPGELPFLRDVDLVWAIVSPPFGFPSGPTTRRVVR